MNISVHEVVFQVAIGFVSMKESYNGKEIRIG